MTLRRLHHGLAAVVAAILLFMTASGVLLNHSRTLGLDTRPLPDGLVQHLLRVQLPQFSSAWKLGDRVLISGPQGSWLPPHWHDNLTKLRVYAIPVGFMVETEATLYLYDTQGALITPLRRPPGQLTARWPLTYTTAHGTCSTLQLTNLTWTACPEQDLNVSSITPLPGRATIPPLARQEAMKAWKLAHHYTWETLLLKLHNGTLFGAIGALLLDGFALLIVLMLYSGLTLRRRRRS